MDLHDDGITEQHGGNGKGRREGTLAQSNSLKTVFLGKGTEMAMAIEKKIGQTSHASEAGLLASGVARALGCMSGRLGSREAGWGPNAVPPVLASAYWWLFDHLYVICPTNRQLWYAWCRMGARQGEAILLMVQCSGFSRFSRFSSSPVL